MKKEVFLLVLLCACSFVIAAPSVVFSDLSTSLSINEDSNVTINITIPNDYHPDTLHNVTNVTISLPSELTFYESTVQNSFTGTPAVTVNGDDLVWGVNPTTELITGGVNASVWFTAIAATPGDYTISVSWTNWTSTYSSNLDIEVNDTTSPTINLMSPEDDYTTVASAYSFTFNVSDDSTISFCDLYINNSFEDNITTVSLDTEEEFSDISLADGKYSWKVGCSDSSGNFANSSTREIIFAEAEDPATPTTTTDPEIYSPSFGTLEVGYSKTVGIDDIIEIPFGDFDYEVSVYEINETGVRLDIDGELIYVLLDDEILFDLDLDGTDDLKVLVDTIGVTQTTTKLVLTLINSQPDIEEESSSAATGDEERTVGVDEEDEESDASDEESSFNWVVFLSIIGGFFLIAFIFIGYKLYKEKQMATVYY